VSRLWSFARSYGFDLLIAVGAIESALAVALRHDAARQLDTTLWFAVPAVAIVVLALLWRRRFPFAAPAVVWLMAGALSTVDGRLIASVAALTLAGMAASFLLGNLPDAFQGRVGLAVVLGGAAIVVYNDPNHAAGELIFTPACSRSGGSPGSLCASAPRRPRRPSNAPPTPSAGARRTLAAPCSRSGCGSRASCTTSSLTTSA